MAAIAGAERAGPIAVAQALDLDDLGAMLGQQHGAVGAGDALAEIDDLQAGERRLVAHVLLSGIAFRPFMNGCFRAISQPTIARDLQELPWQRSGVFRSSVLSMRLRRKKPTACRAAAAFAAKAASSRSRPMPA